MALTRFSVCQAYKLLLLNEGPIISSLAKRSVKYQWAADKYARVMADREAAVNALFNKLTELDTDGYYDRLFRSNLDKELSHLFDAL